MSEQEIILRQPVPLSINIGEDLKDMLAKKWIWAEAMVDKISNLLEAKTLNNKWDEMNDNKAQQAALELAMKIYWIKWLWKWTNIAIFNNIPKDEKLQY